MLALGADLNDHELGRVVELQRGGEEPALAGPDGVPDALGLGESDLIRFPPGENVEEPAQPAVVCGEQPVEDLPLRRVLQCQ